jgi:multidrug efflux pump subunit AcrA (membrane-fusion protein)
VTEPSGHRWRGRKRRPLIIGTTVVVALVVIGGATALAASSSGDSGYRMTTVVRTSVGSTLGVVGTIEPVNDASASFQVGGKVASVTVAAGDQVTAGETLASLDTTSLSESVSSAELSLQSDDAKLTEDEDSETSGGATTTPTTTSVKASSTSGDSSGSGGAGGGSSSGPIGQDQSTLVADQAKSSADQQQEAADLAQAETACGISSISPPAGPSSPTKSSTSTSTSTSTPPTSATSTGTGGSSGGSGCTTAVQQVATDQQSVATDQQKVATDENTLAKALTQEASTSSSSSSTTTPSTSTTGAAGTGDGGNASRGSSVSGAASDSATQIASDEATIDTAQANVVETQQSLAEGQLTSPINGTIVSVGIDVGDTVAADSSTSTIVIIGTKSFEATATLTSAQVPLVKVGSTADVSVDGTTGTIAGTVTQVGPVQSGESGYSYPAVVTLPSSANNLFSGSSANISIVTGEKQDVLAVPTSAVATTGTQSFVVVLSGGKTVDTPIKVGIVGSIYTQVLSGLKRGEAVVLADYSTPVPASNTSTFGGFGGGGGFGAGGFTGGGLTGGGTARFSGGPVTSGG